MVQCLRLQDAIVGVEGVILVGLLKSYMLFRAAKRSKKRKKKKKETSKEWLPSGLSFCQMFRLTFYK